MWAVVGLGNPGREYADTRHNAGYLAVKRLAGSWDVRVKKPRYLSKTAELKRGTEKALLGEALEKAREALELIVAGDIDRAMNLYN